MNYYEHHLADYTQATAHLSMLEDAAYSRMLRWYYANEKPLPADIKAIERLVRAQSKQEREAVKTVLDEFFVFQDGAYHQDRADKEIWKYQDKQRKSSASANARWNKQQTHCDGNANASQTHCDGNAHQTPNTKHQTPDTNQDQYTPSQVSNTVPSKAGAVCVAIRAEGIASTNPGHPDLIALIESGAEIQEFVDAAREAQAKGKGFDYLLGIVKGRRLDSARQAQAPPRRKTIHEERAETIAAMTGRNQNHAPGNIIDITEPVARIVD